MADHIIDIPDGVEMGSDRRETIISALHIHPEPQHQSSRPSPRPILSDGSNTLVSDMNSSSKNTGTEIESTPIPLDSSIPSVHEPPHRWYFEHNEEKTTPSTRCFDPVAEYRPPISITHSTQYLSCNLAQPTNNRGLYDMVFGVSIKDLKVDAIQAILFTVKQTVRDNDSYKTEVIGASELKRLCAGVPNQPSCSEDHIENNGTAETDSTKDKVGTEEHDKMKNDSVNSDIPVEETKPAITISPNVENKTETSDNENAVRSGDSSTNNVGNEITFQVKEKEEEKDVILWWKMRENFALSSKKVDGTPNVDGTASVVFEIKTWKDVDEDYGTLKLHCIELHVDARESFKNEPLFREHRPYLGSADINRTGYVAHDKFVDSCKAVTNIAISAFRTHLLLVVRSGSTRTLQLWDLQDPSEETEEAVIDESPDQDSPSVPTAPPSRKPSIRSIIKPSIRTPRPSLDVNDAATEKAVRLSTAVDAILSDKSPDLIPDSSRPDNSDLQMDVANTDADSDPPASKVADDNEDRFIPWYDDISDDEPFSPEIESKEPFPLGLLAWMPLSLPEESQFDNTISADGTQIVLLDFTQLSHNGEMKKDYKSHTRMLRYTPVTKRPLPDDDNSAGFGFSQLDIGDCWSKIQNYVGKGVFHIVDVDNPDITNELFITYNGVVIDIYTVHGQWIHTRTIIIEPSKNPDTDAVNTYLALENQLRGKFFVIENSELNQVSTWDIEKGERISFITNLTTEQIFTLSNFASMADYGTIIAIPGAKSIIFYRTTTWIKIGECFIEDMDENDEIDDTMYVNNDTLLIVSTSNDSNEWHSMNKNYIIDFWKMQVIGTFIAVGSDYTIKSCCYGRDQLLCWVGDTTVDVIRFQDRLLNFPTHIRKRCDTQCREFKDFDQRETEYTSSSGLKYTVKTINNQAKIGNRREKMVFVEAKISDPVNLLARTLTLPITKGSEFMENQFKDAGYFCDCKYLVIALSQTILVWSTPPSMDEDFKLMFVHHLNYDQDFQWNICRHEQIHVKCNDDYYMAFIESPATYACTLAFLNGILDLIKIYEFAKDSLKKDIIQYVGERINLFPLPESLDASILPYICQKWTTKDHDRILEFISDLLDDPYVRWVPIRYKIKGVNPIQTILDHATTTPKALFVAEAIIDYCIRKARDRSEKSLDFLLPIRFCLHELTDPMKPYSEIALKALRGFAYFKARDHQVIMEYHTIAHPYEFRWKFWQPNTQGLDQYMDQVLQLSPKRTPFLEKDRYNRTIYAASFDMLWYKINESDENSNSSADENTTIFSWPLAFISVIRRKLTLTHNATVECYSFDSRALDNPALAALVEYKWNTIGRTYWLVRFLAQCSFYCLVLTAVLMEIYGFDDNSVYEGLFIAIIIESIIFLWLEVIQLFKDKSGYIRSIYNIVDILAFLSPLAGSITQLYIIWGDTSTGWNPPLLSFSVLFIFLHFLFELRVIRGVCQFVSIIIKAISSIRVFFFVFAGGLLGFAIAIIHLLHGCTGPDCLSAEGYSDNLLRAISMVYFMMGGRYDPVDNGFSSDDVAFHLMMMVFFFFTVIVMLNVLIALINNATNDGDQKWNLDWLENRMRLVESAENMTYVIPGWRSSKDCFPDIIYYTDTTQQSREYEKRTRRLIEESTSVVPTMRTTEEDKLTQLGLGGSGNVALFALLKQYHEEHMNNYELQKKTIAELKGELKLLRERIEQTK